MEPQIPYIRKLWLLCLLSVCAAQTASPQQIDFDNYTPLSSRGNIPQDFTTLSSKKYEEEKQNIDYSEKEQVRNSQDKFFLESNFAMDRLLHSGRVIFGDEVTDYLNTIKNNLLRNNPELKNKIRIYTFRSNEVNAFTANNGIVLVTTGLVAQAQNEAELAFVLSHEFQHYIKQHALNSYVENKQMERGDGIYKNLNPNDIELTQLRYAKDQESEADELGTELFKKSDYSPDAANNVFDVLLYSYLPFDEIEFKENFFNTGKYILPAKYFLDTVQAISAADDNDDSKSDHPNIKKRREAVEKNLTGLSTENKKLFIQPESDFARAQKICRYETLNNNLNDLQYEDAVYSAYLLLQNDSNSVYLQKQLAKAVYAYSTYKTKKVTPENHVNYKKIEGSQQQVYYLFNEMPAKELSILALKTAWPLYTANKKDKEMELICNQLVDDIVNKHKLKYDDFISVKDMKAEDSVNVPLTSDTIKQNEADKTNNQKSTSKYDKIKKKEEIKPAENNYWKYAFVNINDEAELRLKFTEAEKEKITYTQKKKSKHNSVDVTSPEIKDVVIINPLYIKVDETNKSNPVQYMAAEEQQIALKDKILQSANLLGINVQYMETVKLEPGETDKFNDIAKLNDWLSENLAYSDKNITIVNSMTDEMLALADKYKTEYFAWLGVISFREKEKNLGLKLFAGVVYWPYLPFAVLDAITPNYITYFFTIVNNAKTGALETELYNVTELKDNESVQKSNIYYILQQMKNQSK